MTKEALRTASDLAAAGLVSQADTAVLEQVARRYAVAITPAVATLIDRADANDPIARQFVPSADELAQTQDERDDPIGDDAHSPVPGIVHRYPDRVLLKIVSACPVYCRFCFRRVSVGKGRAALLAPDTLANALAYIAADTRIWEVILTGGDPFILSARRAREVTTRLAAIPHVRIIRWHTRVPVTDPSRVTPAFVRALKAPDATTYVALHANHPRELTLDARKACARIIDAGIPMIAQTVLLTGINDDPATLEALMRALVETRVKPYYLHHADRAPGTAHFRTPLAQGQRLMRHLHQHASGLCQPTYVLDIPGGYGKVPVGPRYLEDGPTARIEDGTGRFHPYKEP